jgi:hypothetical protein
MKINKKQITCLLFSFLLSTTTILVFAVGFTSTSKRVISVPTQKFDIRESDIIDDTIILDASKIDVSNSKCFTIGFIYWDSVNEFLTFKSFVNDA